MYDQFLSNSEWVETDKEAEDDINGEIDSWIESSKASDAAAGSGTVTGQCWSFFGEERNSRGSRWPCLDGCH